jgi:hypothetical protein
MRWRNRSSWICTAGPVILFLSIADMAEAHKAGIHLIYMEPNGPDAEDYSDPALGLGVHAIFAMPRPLQMFGFVVGAENTFLKEETRESRDSYTGARIQEKISQRYTRLFVGAELGGHGRGFFRPHIGINFAIVNYGFTVAALTFDEEDAITQNFSRDNHWVFGQDITLGLDLRVSRKVFVDVGIRYLKSYREPVQLHEGLTRVHPEYFQVYIAFGNHSE